MKRHGPIGWACVALGISALALETACVSARTRSEYDEASQTLEASQSAATAADPRSALPDDEASLAREARLEAIERIAIAHNPDLAEARERVAAGLEQARSLGHWPDPELKYELWGQPLARPYALGEAQTHMIGLRQTIPAPGSVDARARGSLEEAKLALQARATRAQEVVADVRRAYATFYRASREKIIHINHVELATDLVDLARANYAAGKGTQQDVLRLIVELSKLHNDISVIDQQIVSSRTRLNALMGRAADAPMGPPADLQAPGQIRLDDLEKGLRARRPELIAALTAIRRREAGLDEAKSRAHWPAFMVGLDYWFMPQLPDPHAYGAMVAMTIPWLNPAHAEEVRAAEHELSAERHSVISIENASVFQLRDAAARLEAARQSLVILDHDLLPQARQSFEATRASFSVGSADAVAVLDAFRSYLDVRLEHERALARAEESFADLERAAGLSLPGDSNSTKAEPR